MKEIILISLYLVTFIFGTRDFKEVDKAIEEYKKNKKNTRQGGINE